MFVMEEIESIQTKKRTTHLQSSLNEAKEISFVKVTEEISQTKLRKAQPT